MNIHEAKIAVVQDSDSYNQVIKLMLKEAAKLRIEATLPAGLAMLRELASGSDGPYHLLALDENLSGDDDGEDGKALYNAYKELGLSKKLPVVSISTYSQVDGIHAIGGFAKNLVDYIRNI